MQQQQTIILAVAASVAALLLPLLVYHQVQFTPHLKDAEQNVATFKPTTLAIPRTAWQPAVLSPPVTAPLPPQPAAPSASPAAVASQLPKLVPAAVPPPTVSFILSDGGKDMAIINGAVLKPGDRYQEWWVERIERNRVLLSGRKGPLWITLQ